jgi:hypothetical protein
VQKAMRIDLVTLIDNAWEHIAEQFMPNGPQDRGRVDSVVDRAPAEEPGAGETDDDSRDSA